MEMESNPQEASGDTETDMDVKQSAGDMENSAPEDAGNVYDVAIQGVVGCFHEAAAVAYFDSVGARVRSVECETFHDLFDALAADRHMFGVVAIENTIAGPLLQNHELLRESGMTIVGGDAYAHITLPVCIAGTEDREYQSGRLTSDGLDAM